MLPQSVCYQNPSANQAVIIAALSSRQSLAFCPAHNGEQSPLPCASAAARSGPIALPASGNAGAVSGKQPSSRISRLTMPRAGRPEKAVVNAVQKTLIYFREHRSDIRDILNEPASPRSTPLTPEEIAGQTPEREHS